MPAKWNLENGTMTKFSSEYQPEHRGRPLGSRNSNRRPEAIALVSKLVFEQLVTQAECIARNVARRACHNDPKLCRAILELLADK